jgi:hypothetical protein
LEGGRVGALEERDFCTRLDEGRILSPDSKNEQTGETPDMQIVETPGHGLFAEQPKYLRVSE